MRRLYKPAHKKLPLPAVIELNRRLVTGYTHFKNDPRIIHLRTSVTNYNRQLRLLGLRDHQVEYAHFSIPKVMATLAYRSAKLVVLGLGALPGFILFLPVFIASKIISIQKAREALLGSTVKIQGRDVMATWKLLVALAFAPVLYNAYVILFCWWTAKHRFFGLMPDWMPTIGVALFGWILFPAITFAALRFGEIGMDIFKSLRPLMLSLNPTSANTLVKLRERRAQLSMEVTDVINALGPEVFPDFDSTRILTDPFKMAPSPENLNIRYEIPTRDQSDILSAPNDRSPVLFIESSGVSPPKHQIPRNESFGNLSNIGLFASRPASRARSRSNSGGFSIKPLSGMEGNDQGGFEEVSKRISSAMAERRRRKASGDGRDWEEAMELARSSDASEQEAKKDM